MAIAVSALFLLAYAGVIYGAFFRTGYIVDKLRLGSGFDEEVFSFKWSPTHVLRSAILVTAGIIIFKEVPDFCSHLATYFQVKEVGLLQKRPDLTFAVRSGVRLLMASVLIGEREGVVKLLLRNKCDEVKSPIAHNS
jgi:hypothetical protein